MPAKLPIFAGLSKLLARYLHAPRLLLSKLPIASCTTYHHETLQGSGFMPTFAVSKEISSILKIGDKLMITGMTIGAMLLTGTVFSIWMAKHDNLEVR